MTETGLTAAVEVLTRIEIAGLTLKIHKKKLHFENGRLAKVEDFHNPEEIKLAGGSAPNT